MEIGNYNYDSTTEHKEVDLLTIGKNEVGLIQPLEGETKDPYEHLEKIIVGRKGYEPIIFAVTKLPKNCNKCYNRRYRAWNVTKGIPQICKCLSSVLAFDDKGSAIVYTVSAKEDLRF